MEIQLRFLQHTALILCFGKSCDWLSLLCWCVHFFFLKPPKESVAVCLHYSSSFLVIHCYGAQYGVMYLYSFRNCRKRIDLLLTVTRGAIYSFCLPCSHHFLQSFPSCPSSCHNRPWHSLCLSHLTFLFFLSLFLFLFFLFLFSSLLPSSLMPGTFLIQGFSACSFFCKGSSSSSWQGWLLLIVDVLAQNVTSSQKPFLFPLSKVSFPQGLFSNIILFYFLHLKFLFIVTYLCLSPLIRGRDLGLFHC